MTHSRLFRNSLSATV